MSATQAEVDAAVELLKKIRANGINRALSLMSPPEVALARRLIVHALQAFVAPQVVGLTASELASTIDKVVAAPSADETGRGLLGKLSGELV